MDIENSEYLRFNNLYIGPDGIYGGVGTYSTSWGFISGTAIINGTFSGASQNIGYSASFVFYPRVLSMGINTTYTPGTNSIVYVNKTTGTNLTLTIATPSLSTTSTGNDGCYVIIKRTDTNAGNLTLQPSSSVSIVPRGTSVASASNTYILNGNSSPTSIKMVYYQRTWYEV